MKILQLTLKKKWFDMILSGEKTEEYRTIKDYWKIRLCNQRGFKEYTHILFVNGYGKSKPRFLIKLKRIEESFGKTEWGAESCVKYFVLFLGDICERS